MTQSEMMSENMCKRTKILECWRCIHHKYTVHVISHRFSRVYRSQYSRSLPFSFYFPYPKPYPVSSYYTKTLMCQNIKLHYFWHSMSLQFHTFDWKFNLYVSQRWLLSLSLLKIVFVCSCSHMLSLQSTPVYMFKRWEKRIRQRNGSMNKTTQNNLMSWTDQYIHTSNTKAFV